MTAPPPKASVAKSNRWTKEQQARGLEVDQDENPYLTPDQAEQKKNKWWYKIKQMLGYQNTGS